MAFDIPFNGSKDRGEVCRKDHGNRSVKALVKEGVTGLARGGITNAANEALWLVEAATGLSRLEVYTDPDREIEVGRWDVAVDYFSRRAEGEPLQYILGTQEFYGLEFRVPQGVFIPRPETELIIEEIARQPLPGSLPLVADVGTGSGCLAVTLAVKNPHFLIVAIDQSSLALKATQANAVRHQVTRRLTCVRGNLLASFSSKGRTGLFSAIVANPPYIPTSELATLPKDVRKYEPHLALDGGVDGLAPYRILLRESKKLLQPRGRLVLELGMGQVQDLCGEAEQIGGYRLSHIQADSAGIDRVLSFERTGDSLETIQSGLP